MMYIKMLLTTTAIATITLSSCVKDQTKDMSKKQDIETYSITEKNAEALYDYAYPLVLMKITQDMIFTAPFRDSTHPNEFLMIKKLATPDFKAVVLPNRNTLYCSGWMDLSKGPVVFEIPDMGDRYYVMPILDAWTNTFISIGSRTTGQKAQKYFLVNKEWSGKVPAGYKKIVSPTNMAWLTGRIEVNGEKDALVVNKLQDKYVLETYTEKQGGKDPFVDYKEDFKAIWVRKPVPYSLKMDDDDYYDTFFKQRSYNSPLAGDTRMLEIMKKAGITKSTKNFDQLSENVRAKLAKALEKKQSAYLKDFYAGKAQTTPWIFNTNAMSNWGSDYKNRAYWAMWGLGGNIPKDAVYGITQLDFDLKQLKGEDTYLMHLNKDQVPKVGGFWSISTYDNDGYLEENDANRYVVGSMTGPKFNSDGSLDVYLSHDKPKGVLASNWVPTPEDEFKILFRMYWPKPYILNGKYKLPKLIKVNKKSYAH